MLICSNEASGDRNHPEWHLDEGNGTRTFDVLVTFPAPFQDIPKVTVALKHIDFFDGAHRLNVKVQNVSTDHFEVVFETWADTRVASAAATWVAYDKRLHGPGAGTSLFG